MIFGDKDDYGFLLAITPLILYKQGNWGDWADFIEKYGSPSKFMNTIFMTTKPVRKHLTWLKARV